MTNIRRTGRSPGRFATVCHSVPISATSDDESVLYVSDEGRKRQTLSKVKSSCAFCRSEREFASDVTTGTDGIHEVSGRSAIATRSKYSVTYAARLSILRAATCAYEQKKNDNEKVSLSAVCSCWKSRHVRLEFLEFRNGYRGQRTDPEERMNESKVRWKTHRRTRLLHRVLALCNGHWHLTTQTGRLADGAHQRSKRRSRDER